MEDAHYMGLRWRGAMSLLQGELAGLTPTVSTFVMRRHNNVVVYLWKSV